MSNKTFTAVIIGGIVILASFGFLGYALMHQKQTIPANFSDGAGQVNFPPSLVTNTSVVCGATTSTLAVPGADIRYQFIATANSSTNITLCEAATCTAGGSITLVGNGGAVEPNYSLGLYRGPISCIGNGASSSLGVMYAQQ